MRKEFSVGGITISSLEVLQSIKLEPGEKWKITAHPHNIDDQFTSGLLGKTGFLLLEVIARTYAKMNAAFPPRKEIVKEGDETMEIEIPFYGDHQFLETISIDYDNKVIELYFGS